MLSRALPQRVKRVLRQLLNPASPPESPTLTPQQYTDLLERADVLSRRHEQEMVRITAELRNRQTELEARLVELAATRVAFSSIEPPAPVRAPSDRYLDYLGGRKKLLELECGAGHGLQRARSLGLECMGVERTLALAEQARLIGLHIIVAEPLAALAALELGQVDTIVVRTATHAVLERSHAVLPSGGLLLLELEQPRDAPIEVLREIGFTLVELDPESQQGVVVRAHKSP